MFVINVQFSLNVIKKFEEKSEASRSGVGEYETMMTSPGKLEKFESTLIFPFNLLRFKSYKFFS